LLFRAILGQSFQRCQAMARNSREQRGLPRRQEQGRLPPPQVSCRIHSSLCISITATQWNMCLFILDFGFLDKRSLQGLATICRRVVVMEGNGHCFIENTTTCAMFCQDPSAHHLRVLRDIIIRTLWRMDLLDTKLAHSVHLYDCVKNWTMDSMDGWRATVVNAPPRVIYLQSTTIRSCIIIIGIIQMTVLPMCTGTIRWDRCCRPRQFPNATNCTIYMKYFYMPLCCAAQYK